MVNFKVLITCSMELWNPDDEGSLSTTPHGPNSRRRHSSKEVQAPFREPQRGRW